MKLNLAEILNTNVFSPDINKIHFLKTIQYSLKVVFQIAFATNRKSNL